MLSRSKHAGRGFTLLEVIIATAILAMLTVAIYRFISTTLLAVEGTTRLSEERQSVAALARVVQSMLNDLPAQGTGLLTGSANRFKELSSDEMTWICRAGPGLMTGAGPGEYRVTMTVQPTEADASVLELGLRRELVTAEDKSDVDFFTRGKSAKYNWLPLIKPVAALEIRYWDARTNSLIKQWKDLNARPSFVHMKIWKQPDDAPFDIVMPIPSARMQAQ